MQGATESKILIGHDDRYVDIEKVRTRQGERARIFSSALEASNEIDALGLESLTWQDPQDLDRWARESGRDPVRQDARDSKIGGPAFTVSNEYTVVELRESNGAGGSQVELSSLCLGKSISLGIPELEWIAVQEPETFSDLLYYPFGPDVEFKNEFATV